MPSPVSAPVMLVVRGDALPIDALRVGLTHELNCQISLADEGHLPAASDVLTMTYRRASRELAVTWDGADRRTITRVIAAPDEPNDVVSEAVLLAGNLARDGMDGMVRAAAPASPPPPAPIVPMPVAVPVPEEPEHTTPIVGSLFFPLATNAAEGGGKAYFDFNLVYGRVGALEGAQIGLVNLVAPEHRQGRGTAEGLQVGLAANVVANDVSGLQAAGILNLAGRLSGLQVALVNVAGDVDGVQVGLVNIARKVRGGTVGVVTVADDIDGVPLAPIAVTKSGGVHPELWAASSGLANAGIRFSTRSTYTVFFGAYHRAFDLDFYGGGLAIGGRVQLGAGFHADVDLGGTYLIAPKNSFDSAQLSSYHQQLVQPRVRMLFGYRVAEHFGLFTGGSVLAQIRSELDWDRVTVAVGPEIVGGVEL